MMKYFRCERGLAMLEAVLATAVFGILILIALPKLGWALDVSYADYEIRCLHSMFHYTKSVSRLSSYSAFGFTRPGGYDEVNAIELRMFTGNNNNPNYYSVRKRDNINPILIKENHYLERKFELFTGAVGNPVLFDVHGNLSSTNHAGTITLRKGNLTRELIVTQYGRARINFQ